MSLRKNGGIEDVLKRIGKRAEALALEEIGSIDRKDG